MARLQGYPMTPAEFEQALADACEGIMLTDQGATEEVWNALVKVAAAAPSPARGLLDAARQAYAKAAPS